MGKGCNALVWVNGHGISSVMYTRWILLVVELLF